MDILYQNNKKKLSSNATVSELISDLSLTAPDEAVSCKVNGRFVDANSSLKENDQVELFNFSDKEGKEVFWHSSAHVLAEAVLKLWPEAQPTIGPAIEEGFYYDFANLTISEDDFPRLEKEIKSILKQKTSPKKQTFANKGDAISHFQNNPYKKELIEGFDEECPLTGYTIGSFFDLCRGPHLSNTGKIKAFKVLKTSAAYWKGDPSREMLTRIYAISFPSKEELQLYVKRLEEAKKRDHRLLGAKLDLFSFKEEAPGIPLIHPNGMMIWNAIIDYWREIHQKNNYEEIKTPHLLNQELWMTSGHWQHYRENMYTLEVEEKQFAVKPMNCPGCMLYYKNKKHSYREFPLKVAELGLVHRHEASGSLNGLLRVRSFHQDDAHIFMTLEQITEEIVKVLKLVDEVYSTFGLETQLELSTRPEKSIGTDEEWTTTTAALKEALDIWEHPYVVNEGDGAFYGPKIDFHVKDTLGRSWQCGTVQLDMSLPVRFDLVYIDHQGEAVRPIMVHRAILGSIERFFAILIEHFAGNFPLWLSPHPIRILPVAAVHHAHAHECAKKIREYGFHVEVQTENESLGKKIRTAQLEKVNYMLTIGDQEVENGTCAVRTRDNVVHGEMPFTKFVETITIERDNKALCSPLK